VAYLYFPTTGVIAMKPSILPAIITDESHGPIQPLGVDLSYLADHLNQQTGPHILVASASKFGWKGISTQTIVIYTDKEEGKGLVERIRMEETLTIIITGEISHCTTNKDEAIVLLNPADKDKVAISQRMTTLRSNSARRVPEVIGPVCHGQSLSLFRQVAKGSFGVYLTPTNKGFDEAVYGPTAAHVLQTDLSQASERRLITPGGLAILTKLEEIRNGKKSREDDLEFFLGRWHESCGEVIVRDIGTNNEG
jgi:hypothetical protein